MHVVMRDLILATSGREQDMACLISRGRDVEMLLLFCDCAEGALSVLVSNPEKSGYRASMLTAASTSIVITGLYDILLDSARWMCIWACRST